MGGVDDGRFGTGRFGTCPYGKTKLENTEFMNIQNKNTNPVPSDPNDPQSPATASTVSQFPNPESRVPSPNGPVSSDPNDPQSPATASTVSQFPNPESRVPVSGSRFPVPESRVPILILLLFILLGSILYARTLHIPWIFDDLQNILENPLIRDLKLAASRVHASRGVAFLTFALNYRFGGFDLIGFHLVNIALHIGSSWLVFLLMRRICRESFWLPLVGGLIFLAHPLQTQAVNYIVQRMAGMCAFFMLAAVYFYMRSRDSGLGTLRPGFGTRDSGFGKTGSESIVTEPLTQTHEIRVSEPESLDTNHESRIPNPESRAFYFLSLVCCALALWTKQNAVVLPFLLLLVDRFFIDPSSRRWKRRLLYVAPFFLLTLISGVKEMRGHDVVLKEAKLAQYWSEANETSANLKVAEEKQVSLVKPPENLQAIYLVTEFSVLWLYIRLLFFPVGQVFDYGYPLVSAIVTLPNAIALLGHLLLMGIAFKLRNRRPLLSVGIAWFYLSLAVESSIIPLDAAVEHRVYMATFGFALVLLDLLRSITAPRAGVAVASAIVLVLSVLTWQRNTLWADPVAFARDNVEKAPFNQRNYLTLATAYADTGQWVEAEKTLRAAIRLRPDYPVPYENLGSALVLQGRLGEALAFYQIALNLSPDNATTLYNAGMVLVRVGNLDAARHVVARLQPLNGLLAGRLEVLLAGVANP